MKYKATAQIELILEAYDDKQAERIVYERLQENTENTIYGNITSANITRPLIKKI